ncbi:MAG: Ig-like domain-containing protein, partial [Halieaceae bacterium]|nr:Ig-like domain-containing protein [Halieaceae bacterium]
TDVDTQIILYASEAMNEASLASAFRVSEDGVLINGGLVVSGDGRIITFTPDVAFAEGALIQVFIDSAATDVAGNAITGYQSSYSIVAAAESIPGTRPSTQAYRPYSNQTGVALNPVIQAAYNQRLNPASVTTDRVTLVDNSDGSIVTSSLSVVHDGRTIQLIPDTILTANTGYTVTLDRLIEDIDGDQQQYNRSWSFTTGVDAVVDDQSPQVIAISPPDGSSGVPLNPKYHVRYDEAINSISFASEAGMSVSFAADNREVMYSRSIPLPEDTAITETIPAATDLSGNAAVAASTSFVTGSG